MPIIVGSRVRRLPQFRGAENGWDITRGDRVFEVRAVRERPGDIPNGLVLAGFGGTHFDEDRFELVEDEPVVKYALAFLKTDGGVVMRGATYVGLEDARAALRDAYMGTYASAHIIPLMAIESRERNVA